MFKNKILASIKELDNVRGITLCALLIALYVVLNSLSVFITPTNKLTFAFLALAMLGMRFGPVTAFFAGGIADFTAYIIRPVGGAYHPGLMLTVMLSGFVFGLFLYHEKLSLWRIIAARSIINIFLHILLNTFWISTLTGKGYIVLLLSRAVKNITLLPIEIILIFIILKVMENVEQKIRA